MTPINAETKNKFNLTDHRRRTVIPASVRAQFNLEFQEKNVGKGEINDTITQRHKPLLKETLIKNAPLTTPHTTHLVASTTADFEINREIISQTSGQNLNDQLSNSNLEKEMKTSHTVKH